MAKTNVPALADETTPKGRRSKSKALASMKDLENLYAEEAQQAAAAAPVGEGVPRISTKDSVFWMGEQDLPDPLEVIVVADAHLNVWYPDAYDPESPSPPGCFAVAPAAEFDAAGKQKDGTGEASMHAHPTSPKMQGGTHDHDCATCELNQFGSAETGRGKACGNTRQLAVVMADDPAFTQGGDPKVAVMGLSATALGSWGRFVQGLAKLERRPPHGAVIRFSFDKKNPDERRRKAVIAVGYQVISDVAVATVVNRLRREILDTKLLLRPMPVEVRADKKGKRGGTKGRPSAAARREPRRAAKF